MSRLRRIAIVCASLFSAAMMVRTSNGQSFAPRILLPTTTTLAATAAGTPVPSQLPAGTVITLTAQVTSSGTPVTAGQVTFCDQAKYCTDIHVLGTVQLTHAGFASLKITPPPGSFSAHAIFSGTTANATSSSSTLNVLITSAHTTTTTLTSSGIPGNYTLIATVTGAAAANPPAGTVTFQDVTNSNYGLGSSSAQSSSSVLSFTNPANPATQNYSLQAVAADFDSDGIADLAVSNEYSNNISILHGKGDGTFTAGAVLATGTDPVGLLAADFNGDGNIDLAVVNAALDTITIFLGNGAGVFTALPATPATARNPISLVGADFNQDGKLDLAVINGIADTVTILLGNGDGTFNPAPISPVTGQTPVGIVTADFNGDGKADLAITNTGNNTITVLLGNGDGTFSPAASFSGSGTSVAIGVADFNGDGKADLALTSFTNNTVTVLLGNGDGTFTSAGTVATGSKPYAVAVADFNADGIPDIAVANFGGLGSDSATILVGKGDGTFTPMAVTSPGYYAGWMTVADFNGDGRPDVAETTQGPTRSLGTELILLSQLTDTSVFSASGISVVGSGTHLADASYSGDSCCYASSVSSTIPLTALAQATVASLTANPTLTSGGQPVTLTAALSPSTAQNHSPGGAVSFYSNGVLLTTASVMGNAAQAVTTTLPVGPDSITCSYAGDTNFAASTCNAVTVNVLPPQAITFPQPASPAYAGTSVLLNASASSGLPVTYTVVSGPATVSGSVLHYNAAGTVVVEADQGGNGTYGAATPVQVTITSVLLSVPVGTQSASVTTLLTISTSGQLSAINVFTQGTASLDFNFAAGGTCALGSTYAVGDTCTVVFTLKPTHPGLRYGGISLVTSGSVVLGNAYVYGLGTGPQVTYSPAAQSLLGGFYSYPTGVAVDGAGNVFLSDENANSVAEIPVSTGVSRLLGTFTLPDDVGVDGSGNVFVIYNRTSLAEIMAVNGTIPLNPAINVISTNFGGLNGMKVDGNGNVYLAESFADGSGSMIQEVLSVNGSIPANPTVLTLVRNVGDPTGVAVDAAGDVFISDQLGNAYEVLAVGGIIPASPTVVTLASSLNIPTNIALDAAGDVFVSEQGGVAELVAVNGSVPTNPTVLTLGTNVVFAQGLAVDSSGNVFIADDGTPQAVKLNFADAPSLTFATAQVGSTSTDSPQTVTLINDGNANLDWASLPVTSNPTITSGFAFTSTCPVIASGTALAASLAPGAGCAESISFKPVTAGPDSGKFTLTDNNLNVIGAQQNILLNGIGTIAPTQLAMALSPNPVFALQPFSVTLTLTIGNGTGGSGTPDAGQPLTLTYNPGTGRIIINLTTDANGLASYNFPGLHAGNYLIAVSFAGNSGQQPSSISNTEIVNPDPSASVLTIFPTAPTTTDNVVLTATVSAPLYPTPPTGTVTFFNGAVNLGTVALSGAGVAQLGIGTLPVGTYTFSCTYSGAPPDVATSSCAGVPVTVIPPPDFSLTAIPPSITIQTEHHKIMQLTLTAIGSFAGPVYLGCQAPLPPYLTCELPPSETLTVGQTKTFNFTMDTDELLNFLAENQPASPEIQWMRTPGRMVLALLLPLALAGFARRRKTLRRLLLFAMLAVGAAGLTACGNKWPRHTPPGIYTIPVVGIGATSSGKVITHTLNITLTVTP